MQAQLLDWDRVESLKPGTWISVMSDGRHRCRFQSATDHELVCLVSSDSASAKLADPSDAKKGVYETFDDANISGVSLEPHDWSRGPIGLMGAVGGGGGFDSNHEPTSFAGVKVGVSFASLDLQYDRLQAHSGFSTEVSAVIPVFRIPRFRWDKDMKFVRVYAEPGLGYRAGDGPFGGYSSAKVMAVLLTDTWSEKWVSPYIEFQRRFPFESPLQGDNRLTIGIMHVSCGACELP